MNRKPHDTGARWLVFLTLLAFSPTAFAYLDPSTGSMVVSAIVGIFASIALAGAVAALAICGGDEVAPPVRLLDLEAPGPGPVLELDHPRGQRGVDGGLGPGGEALLAPLPPPAPLNFIHTDFQLS